MTSEDKDRSKKTNRSAARRVNEQTVEGRSKSASSRLNTPPLNSKIQRSGSSVGMDSRRRTSSRLSNYSSSEKELAMSKSNSRPALDYRRKSGSETMPSDMSPPQRVVMRSSSVSSGYSTASTYDSRMGDAEIQHLSEKDEVKLKYQEHLSPYQSDKEDIKRRYQEALAERDSIRRELAAKKDEIQGLRDKIILLKRELSEVTTSKGALNEACVSGMMDAFALNSKIAELEEAKESLQRQVARQRQDSVEYDRERRGLLDLLDDSKFRLKECEKVLEMERARTKELETSRSATAERLGMELKFVRRELAEKTIRIKKLAKTNTKLACKLLAVEEEGAEANNLAKALQNQNTQLEGDNQELANFVLQLESQIDQLSSDRTAMPFDMRTQQSTRLEEERAMVLNEILSIEEAIDTTKNEILEGLKNEEELQCLFDKKAQLQFRVSSLTHEIEALKAEDNEEANKMREDYVQRLEADLHTARSRIEELTKRLRGARDIENESMSSKVKASEEISKLEAEKAQLKEVLLDSEAKLKQMQNELENQAHVIRQEREREVHDLQDERDRLDKRVGSYEAQLAEYHRVKQETDNIVRKLRQDIREHEQQKETLAHQVNLLEWQLVGLYSDKENAVKSLAERDMELMRLQNELEDREDELEQIRQEISEENEAQIEACELKYEKEMLEDVLEEKQQYLCALEYELEQLKKDKSTVVEHVKESRRKPRPWFSFNINF